MEYILELHGWSKSVIVTVQNDDIIDNTGMVECNIEIFENGNSVYRTTLDKIRNSMHPKKYTQVFSTYDNYANNNSSYKLTIDEFKGFGGSFVITSNDEFDISNLTFKFLSLSPFANITLLEDLEYSNGEIEFKSDFEFVGKSHEETIHDFKRIPKKTPQKESDYESQIKDLNILQQMIKENESEKSIIEYATKLGVSPYNRDNNFIGIDKLKQRIAQKLNVLKSKLKLKNRV